MHLLHFVVVMGLDQLLLTQLLVSLLFIRVALTIVMVLWLWLYLRFLLFHDCLKVFRFFRELGMDVLEDAQLAEVVSLYELCLIVGLLVSCFV